MRPVQTAAAQDLPAAAYAAGLAALPGMGPARLVELLGEADPPAAWDSVLSGRTRRPTLRSSRSATAELPFPERPPPGAPQAGRRAVAQSRGAAAAACSDPRPWAAVAADIDLRTWWASLQGSGIGVVWRGGPGYPGALLDDPEPPGVVFFRGHLSCLSLPRVAVVGTRRCTPDGRRLAFELGRDLAAAGICVVSGLALGIDGAAHAGALQAVAGSCGAPDAGAGSLGGCRTELPPAVAPGLTAGAPAPAPDPGPVSRARPPSLPAASTCLTPPAIVTSGSRLPGSA